MCAANLKNRPFLDARRIAKPLFCSTNVRCGVPQLANFVRKNRVACESNGYELATSLSRNDLTHREGISPGSNNLKSPSSRRAKSRVARKGDGLQPHPSEPAQRSGIRDVSQIGQTRRQLAVANKAIKFNQHRASTTPRNHSSAAAGTPPHVSATSTISSSARSALQSLRSVSTVPSNVNRSTFSISELASRYVHCVLYRKYAFAPACESISRFNRSHRARNSGDASSGISTRPIERSGKQSNAISTTGSIPQLYNAQSEMLLDDSRPLKTGGSHYWTCLFSRSMPTTTQPSPLENSSYPSFPASANSPSGFIGSNSSDSGKPVPSADRLSKSFCRLFR